MSSQQKSGFRIGDWVVHPRENRLTGSGGDRTLEPRVMDLLVYLAERQGQVVSRQALLDSVWAGTVVGDETLSRAVSLLRTELGDDPRDPRYLKTVSQIGSIKTISATSVRQYLDTEKPMREIAADLGVTTVLEGGIQRVGEDLLLGQDALAVLDQELKQPEGFRLQIPSRAHRRAHGAPWCRQPRPRTAIRMNR